MAISRQSSVIAATNTLTIGSHAANDTLLSIVYRESSTAIPTVPSGWIPIYVLNTSSQAMVIAYKKATSGSETFGTWTNATHTWCGVYRPTVGLIVPHIVQIGSGNSTTWSWPSINAGLFTSNTNWVVGAIGIADGSGGNVVTTAPTGLTHITAADSGTGKMGVNDSNGVLNTFGATTTTGAQATRFLTGVIALIETPISLSSGSGVLNPLNASYGKV